YLDYNNLTEEMYDFYVNRNALNMLQGQAVLLEIAKAEGFSYTPEELEQELYVMARGYQTTVDSLKEMIGEAGVLMVGEDILHKQALNFITEQSVEI
ncbi:MAG: hypothetical protein LUD71_05120, partial [Clostridiales bacterium]|nr:hypothetical protein [Clostridiales bacterium]